MTREEFFAKFELFAELPDAVAKMREVILSSAAIGHLVPQDPGEEGADTALARIESDVVAAVRAKRLRAKRLVQSAREPFALPAGWKWASLGSLATPEDNAVCDGPFGSKLKTEHYVPEPGYAVVRLGNIGIGNFIWGKQGHISEERFHSLPSNHLAPGDLLVAGLADPLLRCCEVPTSLGPAVNKADCFRVRLHPCVDRTYIRHYLNSQIAKTLAADENHGMTRERINLAGAKGLPVPVPPLAEQKRIVAKVDELTALCDQLEAQQKERETRHAALARASLSRFAAAPTPANLTALFHDSYIITPADLRQSILTLALQGKLVPHHPDELGVPSPAKSVATSASPRDGASGPFELPTGWRWAFLGQLSELINGDRSKNYPNKAEYVQYGVPWINTGHIEPDGTLSIRSMNYITRGKFDSLRSGKIRKGDLVYCLRGATLGKTAVITQFDEGAIASSLVIIRLSAALDTRFAFRFLTSPGGRDQIFKFDNGSAQPNLSANNVKKYLVPVPPLAEQRRIVARVDQLMALVDKLEAQLEQSRITGKKLVEAVVDELVETKPITTLHLEREHFCTVQ